VLQAFKNESIILKQVSHKNIVRMFGESINIQTGNTIMFMEMCDASLESYINNRANQLRKLDNRAFRIPMQVILFVCAEISNALDYLHLNRIAHRDIKPGNVLINYGICNSIAAVKMTDFGTSVKTDKTRRSTL
jgi:serine/threonine protein kinase